MKHDLKIKTSTINYLLYAIFVGIFLGLPNICSRYLDTIGISSYRIFGISSHHIVSTNSIIAIITCLYLIAGFKRREFSELSNRYIIMFLFMLGWILISGLNAYDVKLGLLYSRNYLSFYLLSILILWRLKTREDVLQLFMVFFLGGIVFSIFLLLTTDISQIVSHQQIYETGLDVTYRLNTPDINANTLGYLFAILFIINISLLQKKSRLNILLIASAILNLYFIIMTFSRGAFLILIVEIMVYLMLRFKLSKSWMYISTTVLVTYIIADKYFHTHLERLMTLNHLLLGRSNTNEIFVSGLFDERAYLLRESFNIGMQHFFLGVGGYNLNAFVEHGTHNQFLNMFVENGIIPFVMYLLFVVLIIAALLKLSGRFRSEPEASFDKTISACLASIMCGSFIQGMVSYLRYDFWVICGISIAWITIAKKQTMAKESFAIHYTTLRNVRFEK